MVYLKGVKHTTSRGEEGIALILVLFVLAIVLTVTLATSFVYYTQVLSAGRSASTLQAFFIAEGGQEYGRRLLDETFQHFSVPGSVTEADLDQYAAWAESGNEANDNDIGVLRDFVVDFDKFLPRNTMGVISGELGEGPDALEYELAYDFTPTGVDYPDPSDPTSAYVFHYDYEIRARGRKPNSALTAEQQTRMTGTFEVTIFHPSFSFYDFFTAIMQTYWGAQIYFASGEVLDGPVYVGSRPGFAGDYHGGGPTFTDQFQTTWPSYSTSKRIYNPVVTWNPEYPPLWGVDEIPVPTNAYSQERVAMGDEEHADDTSPVTNEERRDDLGLLAGGSAPPQGVYYAKGDGTDDQGNNTNQLLGGIYVYGNVQRMRLGASGNHQYINIKQGGEWTYIDIDNATGTTSVQEGSEPVKNFNGTPNGVLYVNGTLYDLGGDPSKSSAVQSDTEMTIAATRTIYIDNHITYQDDPRNNPDAVNVLGIFSGNGNVLIADDAPSNINVHATMMATSEGKGFGVQNFQYKPPSGALNVLGGIIMHSYQAIGTFNSYGQVSGYYKNFTYDRRFLNPNFHPPYFPVVSPFVGRLRSINRTDWSQVTPPPPEE